MGLPNKKQSNMADRPRTNWRGVTAIGLYLTVNGPAEANPAAGPGMLRVVGGVFFVSRRGAEGAEWAEHQHLGALSASAGKNTASRPVP
jgi:hypothetical protein